MIFGLLTLPLTDLLSKTVFVALYLFGVSFLTLCLLNRSGFLGWLTLLLSLVYFSFTATLRPEYVDLSFRLLTVILIICSALRLAYVYDSYQLEKLIRITAFIGLLSALYGLKQFLFGYTDYEMNLASNIGSIVREFTILNSARSIGISFDPLSQALLLAISFHCFVFINRFEHRRLYKNIYLIAQLFIIVSIALTLNRSGIIAFILSLSLYLNFGMLVRLFSGISGIFRLIIFVSSLLIIFQILSLPEFDYPKRALLSAFEIFGFGNDTDEFFNRSQSFNKRISDAQNIVEIVRNTPFGIRSEITTFTVNDVGILSPIINFGILGGVIILSLMYLPLAGTARYYFTSSKSIKEESTSRLIYSCYLVIAISCLASFSLDGTIMMLPGWFIICLALRNTIRKS